jgi:hypothetical protein
VLQKIYAHLRSFSVHQSNVSSCGFSQPVKLDRSFFAILGDTLIALSQTKAVASCERPLLVRHNEAISVHLNFMDTLNFSAAQLSQMIKQRDISCQELMQATLARIAQVNPQVNAIVNLRPADELLCEAREHDALLAQNKSKGWLHGIPQAIKDIAPCVGLPNTQGSPLLKSFIPKEDALMVQRMKAAGCIVIGKTNTPEFGLGSHTFNERVRCNAQCL